MSKGLEALQNIKLKLMRSYDGTIGMNGNVMFEKEIPIIEKELKALEIISKSLNISVYHSRHTETGYEVCIGDQFSGFAYGEITAEEFDLLKEVLE